MGLKETVEIRNKNIMQSVENINKNIKRMNEVLSGFKKRIKV